MMKLLVALLMLLLLSSCGTQSLTDVQTALKSNGQSLLINNARTPRLSKLSDGLLLSWLGQVKDGTLLQYSIYRNNSWGLINTIAKGDDWFINHADYAKVTVLSEQHFVATWLSYTSDSLLDYTFNVVQSFDGGLSWSPVSTPIKAGAKGQHGFVSVALYQQKAQFVWIEETSKDQFALKTAALNEQNQWGATSTLDALSCSCCHTDITKFNQQLWVAYRHRTKDEIRDIALVTIRGEQKSDPIIVHNDQWRINGCPVNGPVISRTKNQAAIAWFSAAQNTPRVQLKIFNQQKQALLMMDNKEPFGYLDMVNAGDESIVLAWLSPVSDTVALNVQRVNLVTQQKSALKQLILNDILGFPSIAVLGNTIFIAYESRAKKAKVIKMNL